uniref:UPAR/Ly6 domain-containing protein n=1 Tax=Anopheles gambiae TaxID=7165 RepID=A4GSA8_ANOGA|nr:unknown [Anopheles gambiae]
MKQLKISSFLAACMFFGALFAQSVSALRCYQCASPSSWSDCQASAQSVECTSASQMSIMGHSLFLPAESRQQLEPACVSVYAKGTVGGATGYAYVRDCLFNDKSMCSLMQSALPSEIRIVDCDLCTTELCNGASSVTAVTLSSVVMVAIALVLWQ